MSGLPYFVEQKYHDNGKTEARVLTAEEAEALRYYDGLHLELAGYDLYVDGAASQEAARKLARDTLNA